MTVITLSDKTPMDSRYPYRRAVTKEFFKEIIPQENQEKKTYPQGWNAPPVTIPAKEVVIRTSMAEEADTVHLNYLEALGSAWGRHRGIVFSADILWFGLLCELAKGIVENPEPHRRIFTRDPNEKITISVSVGSADDPLPLNAIMAELGNLVPVSVDMFAPRFSTTTDMSRFTTLAAFAEACSPYYSYMTYCCDIPLIRIEGEQRDFEYAHECAVKIHDEFARTNSPLTPWIAEQMVGLSGKVRDAVKAVDDTGAEFFRGMFTSERCGSGGETEVDGWWSRIYRHQPQGVRKPCNFGTQVARVPWKNADTGREFFLNAGILSSNIDADGVFVPEFHYVQTEKVG